MLSAATEDEQRRSVTALLPRADLTVEQLWLDYFALGGEAGQVEVEAYVAGLMPLPALQRDLLAQAVNERLDQVAGTLRASYSRAIREPLPDRGPLPALVHLLEGAPTGPPERLPYLAEEAGDLLGVRVVMYLADYQQRELLPLDGRRHETREPLGIDGTLAGRAFRLLHTIGTVTDGTPRLWVPLRDGTERLGVLDIMVSEAADLPDPLLRDQCRWMADLIGHLVTLTARFGDALSEVRRLHSRTTAAELVWSLLPPLTAASNACTVAGMVEPSYAVGGDIFDYSLSGSTLTVAVFDAMGHGLGGGLLSAAALSAYRAARRNGADIFDRATAIDDALVGHADGEAFVTGILADLDLRSGQLRYLAAGHPPPMLLRNGRLVTVLPAGRRLPFGLGIGERALGHTSLQPGDWLALYTDGVTEARDPDGRFFGTGRLTDFLEREAASGQPAPETLRRLIHAVLTHQNGVLQDDATVLLAHWHPHAAGADRALLSR